MLQWDLGMLKSEMGISNQKLVHLNQKLDMLVWNEFTSFRNEAFSESSTVQPKPCLLQKVKMHSFEWFELCYRCSFVFCARVAHPFCKDDLPCKADICTILWKMVLNCFKKNTFSLSPMSLFSTSIPLILLCLLQSRSSSVLFWHRV